MKMTFWSIIILSFVVCLLGALTQAIIDPSSGRWFLWLLCAGGFGVFSFFLTEEWGQKSGSKK